MPTYHIEDGKMETFYTRMESIRKKLRKTGDNCTCREVGIEYKELEDGNTYKFHIMEVEGVVAFEGWHFVAKIEHLNKGNLVKTVSEMEIPERYWHTEGYCDHCKTDRPRKTTYLFEKDGVFYQLGKSCVSLYTEGLDIRRVNYISDFIESLDEEERDYECGSRGEGFTPYFEVKEVLCHALNAVSKFGYAKKYDEMGSFNPNSTFMRVLDSMAHSKWEVEEYANEADKLIEWAKSFDGVGAYRNNLKVIVEEGYLTEKDLPLLVSAVPSFRREEESKVEVNNEFIGKVGDKVSIELQEVSLAYVMDTMFGNCYVYKAKDTSNHVLITRTSRGNFDVNKCKRWVGTIKELSEYKGVKQTVLTRVKFEEA